MSASEVAGIDWAGDGWLAVLVNDQTLNGCTFESRLQNILDQYSPDRVLIDVPIGLPEVDATKREKLDSKARELTGKPSSVFPVPSRNAVEKVVEDNASYEEVNDLNREDLDKGLSRQSYHIAAGIGEVDEFLRDQEEWQERLIESHPELCFFGLKGRPLAHSKKTAAGIGERLSALGTLLDNPEKAFRHLSCELENEASDVKVDDLIDAMALATTAAQDRQNLEFILDERDTDTKGIPMRMAYWDEEESGRTIRSGSGD